MPSRIAARARLLPRALVRRFATRRSRPERPASILVAHNLLLGDTLMLTPLLAKLRERHPAARIAMTVKPPIAPLYAGRPYGVEAIAVDLREPKTVEPLARPRFRSRFRAGR